MESRFGHNDDSLLQASLIALHGSPCHEDLVSELSDSSLQVLGFYIFGAALTALLFLLCGF